MAHKYPIRTRGLGWGYIYKFGDGEYRIEWPDHFIGETVYPSLQEANDHFTVKQYKTDLAQRYSITAEDLEGD